VKIPVLFVCPFAEYEKFPAPPDALTSNAPFGVLHDVLYVLPVSVTVITGRLSAIVTSKVPEQPSEPVAVAV